MLLKLKLSVILTYLLM